MRHPSSVKRCPEYTNGLLVICIRVFAGIAFGGSLFVDHLARHASIDDKVLSGNKSRLFGKQESCH